MKWISVKDRLPERHTRCLVWDISENKADMADRDGLGVSDNYWCFPDYPKGWDDDEISHWINMDDIPKPI